MMNRVSMNYLGGRAPLHKGGGLIQIVLFFLFVGGGYGQEFQYEISNRLLIEGEPAVLRLSLNGVSPQRDPILPKVQGLDIMRGSPRFKWSGRQQTHYLIHIISRFPGEYTIPPIDLVTASGTISSPPLDIKVFDSDVITWQRAYIHGVEMRYGSATLVSKENPYVGEAIHSAIKILLPEEKFSMGGWIPPEIDKENLAAWRFEPASLSSQARRFEAVGYRIILAQGAFNCYTDTSVANALKAGKARIGPGAISPVIQLHQRSGGFFLQRGDQVQLKLPVKSFNAKPLPAGQPTGFQGAIGDFQIQSRLTSEEPPSDGAPVSAEILIRGEGNLDNIPPPLLSDKEGIWKTYPATRNEEQSSSRETVGQVLFSQFLRPTRAVEEIPAFVMSYFNPKSGRYETAQSNPIAIKLRPSVSTNIEDLDESTLPLGLLGLIPVQEDKPKLKPVKGLWHIVPAFVALILLVLTFWRRVLPKFKANPDKVKQARALQELQKLHSSDEAGFLRACGNYVESWLPHAKQEESIRGILAERDEYAFRPNSSKSALDSGKRREILAEIRKYSKKLHLSVLLGLVCLFYTESLDAATESSQYKAAEQAWENRDWEGIISAYEEVYPGYDKPADVWCNMGSAYFRLNLPGQASLSWWRALARNPKHPEARQNLDFIEHEQGLIPTNIYEEEDTWASRLPRSWFGNIAVGALWGILLLALALYSIRHSRILKISRVGLLIAPFLFVLMGLVWFFHPSEGVEQVPVASQAVVVGGPANLYGEPIKTEKELFSLKEGTFCEILAPRGSWFYIALPNGTRGWIKASRVEKVLPGN